MAGHTAVTTRANLSARRVIAAAALIARCQMQQGKVSTFKAFRWAKTNFQSLQVEARVNYFTTPVSETRVVHYYADTQPLQKRLVSLLR